MGLLGFNGEAREHALGWSLLGRGYRAYNPGLMRFHSPDLAAPEVAGINPYVYCGGNPVNWHDPSGHYGMRHSMEQPYIPPKPVKPIADWRSWLGLAMSAAFAVVSFLLLPPVGLTMHFALGAGSLLIDLYTFGKRFEETVKGSEPDESLFLMDTASGGTTFALLLYQLLKSKGAKTPIITKRAASWGRRRKDGFGGDFFVKQRLPGLGGRNAMARSKYISTNQKMYLPVSEAPSAYDLNRQSVTFSDKVTVLEPQPIPVTATIEPSPIKAVDLVDEKTVVITTPSSPTKKWPAVITTPPGNYNRHGWQTPAERKWKV
ncbi:RHS repeat-associated core domain-containing protein [Pseudomonas juntendi]|uniref:RHS repeat-associated core domain-containing protein n=1 Tax=Pseudomonas juntendi TaxID=2666183 RepID=UPI00244B323F|nr:RHS repeat-associated core domain-containing protein [Pseudomonas juntendi]MDH0045642.1 RHS repeat-associated core domain-containing protein [Pseudomonas juntendi]